MRLFDDMTGELKDEETGEVIARVVEPVDGVSNLEYPKRGGGINATLRDLDRQRDSLSEKVDGIQDALSKAEDQLNDVIQLIRMYRHQRQLLINAEDPEVPVGR